MQSACVKGNLCLPPALQADRPEDYLWGKGLFGLDGEIASPPTKNDPDLKIQKHLGSAGFLVVLKISRQLLLTTAIKSDG